MHQLPQILHPRRFARLPGRARWAVLLLLAVPVIAMAQPATRHYGHADGPLEFRLESETANGPWYLQVSHDGRHGHEALMPPLSLAEESRHDASRVIAGQALFAGRPVTLRLRIDGDEALEWLAPEALRRPGAAALPMAGRYPLRSDEARLAAAKTRFAAADDALNAAYRAVRGALSPDAFSTLRDNQRQWLRYRDHFIADGDDAARHGPGTVSFIREQTRRTLARVDFLRAVETPPALAADGVSGLYGDGSGRTLRFALIPTADRHAFVTLETRAPWLHDPGATQAVITYAGRTSPTIDQQWESESGNLLAGRSNEPVAAILFERIEDGRAMLVTESTAEGDAFTGRYTYLGPLTPARLPMRELVRRLPATIFDDTEEGLTEREKTPLLLTGKTEFFTLQEPQSDFLRVRYAVGQIEMRRFAARDGGAFVAISTTNVRARTFALWAFPANGDDPKPVQTGQPPLPVLSAADFHADPGDAPALDPSRLDYSLNDSVPDIRIRVLPDGDAPAADHSVDLVWDGDGFGIVRSAP